MGKNGEGRFFSCLCRPRNPQDFGVITSKTTVAPTPPSGQSKRRGEPTISFDELAVSPFTPEDNSWFRNDNTEPTVQEEDEDEEENGFEAAYRFWYSKGLLSFVPDSIKEAQKMNRDENDWASFSQTPDDAFVARPKLKQPKKPVNSSARNSKSSPMTSKKLDFSKSSSPEKTERSAVIPSQKRTAPPSPSTRVSNLEHKSSESDERRDLKLRPNSHTRSDQALLPPRSKQEDCASCGSRVVTRVRCVQCKRTVYCSMFCRGNDRYKHASICSKQFCTPTKGKSPMTSNDRATSYPQQEPSPSWKKRVSVDEHPQPEAHALRRYWEDRSNLEYSDQ